MTHECVIENYKYSVLHTTCRICRKKDVLRVDTENYLNWRAGGSIQACLPELTPDDREILISGICGKCFDKMFPEE